MKHVAALMLGTLLVGVVAFGASPRKMYLRELDRWTEEIRIYKAFQTALILRGTYLSRPMRTQLADERRRLVNPTPESHAAFVERMNDDHSQFHDVIFSAQTPLTSRQRFGENDSGWTIWLEADGERQDLVSVEHVRRPSSVHTELYAHMNIWSELWIARFRKSKADQREIVFHVGSGFGNKELQWTLDP